MPWVVAKLRGQKVYARTDATGAFAEESGRVEIRYRPNDEKAYRAATRNLERVDGGELLDDDVCVAGAPPPPKAEAKSRTAGAAVVRAPEVSAAGQGWIAYADGACTGNPGPAGAGFVVLGPMGERIEGYEYLGIGTNNVGELTAVLRALECIPGDAGPIAVFTDSKYAIGVLSKGWKAKANQELVASVKRVVVAKRARLEYVPGHSGIALNERADELAREAVRLRSTRLGAR